MVIKEILCVVLVLVATASCGDVSAKATPRLTGGTEVKIEGYNYMARLQDLTGEEPVYPLVILNGKWLISIAECLLHSQAIKPFPRDKYFVMMGSSKITKCGDGAQVKNVANYYLHDGYNPDHGERGYPILIELSEPIVFGPNVGSIKLQDKQDMTWPKHGQKCITVGWGSDESYKPDTLRMFNVTINKTWRCTSKFTRTKVICTKSSIHDVPKGCPSFYSMLVCDDTVVGYPLHGDCGSADWPTQAMTYLRMDIDLAWVKDRVRPV